MEKEFLALKYFLSIVKVLNVMVLVVSDDGAQVGLVDAAAQSLNLSYSPAATISGFQR